MIVLIIILSVIYFFWARLEKYNIVDYGNKTVNRLQGLNQLVSRKHHRLGDYWLELPEGGAIIAANHQSGMDPAVLCAASKRPVRFLTTEFYYKMPIVHSICKGAGCIPVFKDKDNQKALKNAVEALHNGEIIGIFPFGGIHTPDQPEPRLRSGVAVLSKLANVPIIPIHIGGVHKFSYNKVFTSMFFKRSTLKITQYDSIICDDAENTVEKVLDYLYPLISNHTESAKEPAKTIDIAEEEVIEKDNA